jgi:pimeloyl-ACP methyl ester carboxylesterase
VAKPFEITVGGHRLAGLRVGTGNRNGFILALHGGGYDAHYWHADGGHGDVSLITLGAQLGYEVLAIDRPGYGGSAGTEPKGCSLAN